MTTRGTGSTAGRRSLRARLRRLAREVATFGAVGAIGFLVNVAVFNLCIRGFGMAPVRSGVIATVVAIASNYVGNRYWTYRGADKHHVRREVGLFLVFSGIGLVIENGVLALSHYGLGYTSALADNIAKNVIGLGLGTVFRFWSYRTWVFLDDEDGDGPGRRFRFRFAGGGSGGRGRVVGDLTAEKERENRRMLL
ncbi:GtrA family protein [Streptomyces sp. HNM0574]|uniref:GtrA family protein n=1 Tax=Streptomyces sp. HNM0574 TaxID=2714954 RepID=UPI00146BDACA|nr:GtrA family protein [Streptomyces sp. HNM0574]NLU70805.1 GtrA family protein [Streptomyces sp. HNM0574]